MPTRLRYGTPDFNAGLSNLLADRGQSAQRVDKSVAGIIEAVKSKGDQALIDFTRRFDRNEITLANLKVTERELVAAVAAIPVQTLDALKLAATRIEAFHKRFIPGSQSHIDALGVRAGARWTPVDAAGLYVPGGSAAYPSSVLMNAIPARIAGVKRIVIVTPAPEGKINPLVLAAAHIAGVNEIYRIGGAQAVAALAFGTETIAPVDKIVGPGNAYVAEAKRQVFGRVGIDSIAGPSEVLIIANAANDPEWVAADLLAQAEHDEDAQSVLITDSDIFANAVEQAVETLLKTLPRADIARASWHAHGAIILIEDLGVAADVANQIAPEHLQICTPDAEAIAANIRHAGAIFIGASTPEAIGDYVGGPNHVLPTSRSARFSSGLSVQDFMKRTTLLSVPDSALDVLAHAAALIADAEGLSAHAHSLRMRLKS